MKRILLAYSFLILIGISCSPKTFPSSEVSFKGKSGKEIIIIQSKGYGKSETSAIRDAERRAMETVLFVGLPGSEFTRPMAGVNGKEKHEKYFGDFFTDDYYRKFITNSRRFGQFQKDELSKQKFTNTEISINVYSLRNELENNGIIKIFGY